MNAKRYVENLEGEIKQIQGEQRASQAMVELAEERLKTEKTKQEALASERSRALESLAALEVELSSCRETARRAELRLEQEKYQLSASLEASNKRCAQLEQELADAHSAHGTLEAQHRVVMSEKRSLELANQRQTEQNDRAREAQALLVARAEAAEGAASELRRSKEALMDEKSELMRELATKRAEKLGADDMERRVEQELHQAEEAKQVAPALPALETAHRRDPQISPSTRHGSPQNAKLRRPPCLDLAVLTYRLRPRRRSSCRRYGKQRSGARRRCRRRTRPMPSARRLWRRSL